jgi:hypothetical protein
VEEVGMMLAGYREISRAYEWETYDIWPYNIYTMVHAVSTEEPSRAIERMRKVCGVASCGVSFAEKKFKKAAPGYIT